EEAENQNRAPAEAIREIAERRRGDELAERKHREQQADDDRRRAERLRIVREERDDDPEADQVDENRQEDDDERARHSVATFYTIRPMRRFVLATLVTAGALQLGAQTVKPEILGTHGIVAAGRHYSVSAGVRILQQNGNAIDAGVATVFAASVVEISHFGFGGESPAIIYDAKARDVIVINGQGPAPMAATPALFAQEGRPPSNGPLGATIPAMLGAKALALETKGTMRLEQVLQRAIELADGFPMYEFLRHYLMTERKATEQYEWSAKTYYPDGRVPDVGEIFRQPNLAKTLRAIAAADKAAYARTHDRVKAIRAGRD